MKNTGNFKKTVYALLLKKLVVSVLFICSFLVYSFVFFKHSENNSRLYKPYKPVFNNFTVMIELNKTNAVFDKIPFENAYVKLNNNINSFLKIRNFLFFNTNKKINSLEIMADENFKNYKSVFIYNGLKPYYYNDFSNFERTKQKICFNDFCKIYNSYNFPKEHLNNKIAPNYNSHFNTFCNFICGFFSGESEYFLSYCLFGLGLFLLFRFGFFKTNAAADKILFLIIFLFAVVLRLNGYFDTLLLYDDYYTFDISNPLNPLLNIFDDPGNPPLLYLLYRIYFSVVPHNIFCAKTLALLISILSLYFGWYLTKKNFDTKIANAYLFLTAINTVFIYRAVELRSYILQAFLTILLAHFLFKILNTNKNKYLIFYIITAVFAINLHFYESLLLFANYIFALFYLLYKKENKKLLYFTLLHLIPLVSLMPYLIMTGFKKGLMNESFNTWIARLSLNSVKKSVYFLFGGLGSVLLFIFYEIKTFLNKNIEIKYKIFSGYVFFMVLTVLIAAILISFYKPILIGRYLILLIPLVFVCICIFFNFNKSHIVIFFIWVLMIQNYAPSKNHNKNSGLDLIPFTVSKQYKELNKEKNVYAVVRNFTYTKNMEQFDFVDYSKDVNYRIFNPKETTISALTDEIIKNDKNAVIFTLLWELNNENLEKYTCYFNLLQDMCLWKAEVKDAQKY